jgi:phosphohistidine phosphatase SixA
MNRFRLARPMLLALMFAGALPAAQAQRDDSLKATPELLRALSQGGYVLYFRHGHTHWQQKLIDQAMAAEARFDYANCATQRNLDSIGRNDAAGIAAALRAARIPVGKVLASRYCRPAEYVALITGKQPEQVQWLTGLSTPQSLVAIKREVASRPSDGSNTFLGGHGDRPFDLTGLVIQEGDTLVFDPRLHKGDDPGKFRPVAWIKPAEWLASTANICAS